MPAYKKKPLINPITGKRPYSSEFHPQNLIELMAQGYFNAQVYAKWGISRDTFYRWRREHEELETAYQEGLAQHEAYMLQTYLIPMAQGINDGKHSFNAVKYLMDEKYNYSKANATGNTTNISIGNMAISQSSTSEELIAKLNENFKFLEHKNVINVEYKPIENDSESNEQDT